jgi:hypothetical protein
VTQANASQSDGDDDTVGDACDLNDGLIYVLLPGPHYVDWQEEHGYSSWNCYTGDLDVLKDTDDYSQEPGSNPLATQECGLGAPGLPSAFVPDPGKTAFFLVTGVNAQGESGAGTDSSGQPRVMDTPCP